MGAEGNKIPNQSFLRRGWMVVVFLVVVATSGKASAQTVATPVLSPTAGAAYVQFSVTVTDATSGSTIYYTLDGSTPTTSSATVTSGGTVSITKSETLKVYAVKSGLADSAVASAAYAVTGEVMAGQYHVVSLRSDGTVWTWGYNNSGQLGDNSTTQHNSAEQVSGLSGIVQVTAGAYHNLALTSTGTLYAWGLNSSDQLGDTTTTTRKTPVLVKKTGGTNLDNIAQIWSGGYHNFALDNNGTLWAWGLNTSGQLGDGGTTSQSVAEALTSLTGSVTQLAVGSYHTLLLTPTGTVEAWGLNMTGQVGNGTMTDQHSPGAVSGLSGVTITALAGGDEHSVALANDGTVYAWGYNGNGQIGDNTTTNRASAVHLSSFSSVTQIEAGYDHTLALKNDGTMWAWGSNSFGELGNGNSAQSKVPVQVSGISGGVVQLTAGNEDSFVLKNDGTLLVFGSNRNGQLGSGASSTYSNAQQVLALGTSGVLIASGADHSIILTGTATASGWGDNSNGNIGDGTTNQRSLPVSISFSGLTGSLTALAVGGNRSLALDSNATVWSWGDNPIGDNTNNEAHAPAHLTTLSSITALAVGSAHSLAVDSGGHVWAWGANGNGQLGDGTTSTRISPVEVVNITGTGSLSGIAAAAGGASHSLAVTSTGTIYAWGLNSSGQIGDGTTMQRTIPVMVAGVSGTFVAAGSAFSAALDSGGHVWMWGSNSSGQLGNGTTTSQSTPVEVTLSGTTSPYLSNIVALDCGSAFCAALTGTGAVWTWGGNSVGQLGDGTMTDRHNPVQVSNLNGVVAISVGDNFGLALKEDGSLQSWGYNSNGDLGVSANYSVPVTIYGFNALGTVTSPTGTITAPTSGGTLTMAQTGTFTVNTTGTIASVGYYVNATLVGTSTISGSYTMSWIPPTWGNFTFSALATDVNGFTSYLSTPMTVQVPYDFDSDGLPDWWEAHYFGTLSYTGTSSPTGKSLDLAQDYADGDDPTNYWSQGGTILVPVLTLTSGNNQGNAVSTFTPLPLVVTVANGSSVPYANAPVTFTVTSGGGGLSATNTGTTTTSSLTVQANSSGQAQVYYKQPASNSVTSTITATSGGQSVSFTETSSLVPVYGLSLWLNAGTASVSGTVVTGWTDQSPAALVATPYSSGTPPQLITDPKTGQPAVSFDGSSDYFQLPAGFSNFSSGLTSFAVFNPSSTANWGRMYDIGNGAASDNLVLAQYGTNFTMAALNVSGSTFNEIPGSNELALNTPQEYTTLQDGATSLKLFQNGNLVGQNNSILALNNLTRSSNYIGKSNWTANPDALYQGNISEILIYNRPLSSIEQQEVEVYLANKYGLYHPDATWPATYTSDVQALIATNQWSKVQADAYVMFAALNPPVPPAGLMLWLKADWGVSLSGTATLTGTVTGWTDQSPAGLVATPYSSGTPPQLVTDPLTGKPAVSFDGTSDFFQLPSGFNNFAAGLTSFAVFSPSSTASWARMYDIGNGASSDNLVLAQYGTNFTMAALNVSGSTFNEIPGSNELALNTPQEYTALQDGATSLKLFQNGTLVNTNPSVLALNNLIRRSNFIGKSNWSTDSLYQGNIAEVLIYNRPLSSAEQQQVEVYLANKYSLPYHSYAAPVISPSGGSYSGSQTVAISGPASPTVVKYTLDGSSPTFYSTTYTGTFTLTGSALVQATAFFNGQIASPTGTAQFTFGGSNLPTTPASLSETVVSSHEIDLSWTLSGQFNYSGLYVYRSSDGGTTWQLIASLDPSVRSYKDWSVQSGTSYEYYVGTFNSAGESDTTSLSGTTTASGTMSISVTAPSGAASLP